MRVSPSRNSRELRALPLASANVRALEAGGRGRSPKQAQMRPLFIAAGVLLACTLPAVAQTTLPPALEPALHITDRGPSLERALSIANAYVAAHPQDGDGFAVRCILREVQASSRGTDTSQALSDCRNAVSLSPRSAFAHSAYADVLYDMDRFADSLAEYGEAISLGQTEGGIFWKRCDAYRRVGRLDEALADCNKQVALTPKSTRAYYTRGQLQVARGDFNGALADLNIALTDLQGPSYIDALFWRGEAYASIGKYQLADADFSSAIAAGDKSPDSYFQRGQVRRNLNLLPQANADLRKAADLYRALGMTQQARRAETLAAGTPLPAAPVSQLSVAPATLDEMTFTGPELVVLFRGLHAAVDPNDKSVHLIVVGKSAAEMPAYDPKWHYAGVQARPDGTPAITIWLLRTTSQEEMQTAIEAGVFLGLAESGYAGVKWKQLYDAAATADEKLGAAAPDPFANRRSVALQIAKAYEAVINRARSTP